MAKKIVINGSNLISTTQDAWGGQNNKSSAQNIHGTSVPPGAEWGINRGEVERFIKSKIDETLTNIGYYTCSTAAGTAAKTVTAPGYVLTSGGCIRIKMTNTNTANNATLNINSTGAKALYYNGAQASLSNSWEAGEVLEVYYDGTQFQCASGGSEKFATGEKVDETSITDRIDDSNAIVTSRAVKKELLSYSGGSFGIDLFTKTENKYVSVNLASHNLSLSDSQNYDIYQAHWEKGGTISVVVGGTYDRDTAIILFLSADQISTSNVITWLNSNDASNQISASISIPEGTKSIVICNKKTVLATPTIGIVLGTMWGSQIAEVEAQINPVPVYGMSETTQSPITTTQTILADLPITAGHCYKIVAEKLTDEAPNITISMGENGHVHRLIQNYDVFYFVPLNGAASARLYAGSAVSASGHKYRVTIYDNTVPSSLPVLIQPQPSVFPYLEGKAIEEYLTDEVEYKVEKSGVLTGRDVTFVNGFPVTEGHVYEATFVSDVSVGLAFSIGLGSNGQFPQISASTDTTVPVKRTKTATTTTPDSRIYFQYWGTPEQTVNCTIVLKDLTDPTTLPRVIVHQGLETKLTNMIEAMDGAAGGGTNEKLYIGQVKVGQWTLSERISSRGICSDKMVYPYNNMRVNVLLPESLSAQIVTGGKQTQFTLSEWLNDGDSYIIPASKQDAGYSTIVTNESLYCINFSDKADHAQISLSEDDVNNLIAEGAIAFEIEKCREYDLISYNYESDRYTRRMITQSNPIIVHCSDVHGDRYRHMHVLDYGDSINADVVINTGDSVAYRRADGAAFIDNDALMHQRPLLVAIGNHDMIENNAAGAFDDLIHPLVTKCGYLSSQGNAATNNYYYVDDAAKSMRYIILFCYHGGTMTQDQVDWFVATLASVPSGYGVVVSMHTGDKQPTVISDVFNKNATEFTNLNLRGIVDLFITGGSGNVVVNSTITAVCDFTSAASNEFVCWCVGHSHVDRIGIYDDTQNRQVVCMVDATCAVQSENNIPRGIDGCYQDSFNVLMIKRSTHKILVLKIGSNAKSDGTPLEYDEVSYV